MRDEHTAMKTAVREARAAFGSTEEEGEGQEGGGPFEGAEGPCGCASWLHHTDGLEAVASARGLRMEQLERWRLVLPRRRTPEVQRAVASLRP